MIQIKTTAHPAEPTWLLDLISHSSAGEEITETLGPFDYQTACIYHNHLLPLAAVDELRVRKCLRAPYLAPRAQSLEDGQAHCALTS